MRIVFKVLSLLFLLITAGQLNAQDIYNIDPKYPVHSLDDFLQVIKDSTHVYTIEDISKDTSLVFTALNEHSKFLDFSSAYWSKIKLKSATKLKGWTLNLEDRRFNNIAWVRGNGKVDVYAIVDGKLLFHKKTGADYKKSERDIKEKWILNRVDIEIPKDKIVTLIIRVQGNSFGMFPYFNTSLRNAEFQNYHPLFAFHTSFNIFLFGVTFIIFLYHFLQFLYLRQSIFFWFSLWVFLCMITQAMTVGLDTELLLGNVPWFRLPLWLIIPNSSIFFFWFFGRSFIQSKEKFPQLDKFMIALPLLMVLDVVISLVLITFGDSVVFITQVGFHYEFMMLYSIMGLILAVIIAFKRDNLARYFGIGAIIATSFALLGCLWSVRFIRLSFDPFIWSVFLQVITYSFGIAYRQQQLSRKAQEEKLATQLSLSEMQRVKDLDEIKTKFFTNLSHEFRTPLSLILGPLQQVEKTKDANSINNNKSVQISSKAFSMIKRNTERLQSLVDQLLDLSKIESGKLHLNLTKGTLISFIRTLVFSFESMAERRNISFNTSFSSEIDHAFYDKDKLEKIISNLLSNAFKYTPEGGTVTVIVQHDQTHFTVEIIDTGKGIEKEDLKHIFERFYRVHGTEEKGSGIGLALTKELADFHNGQISVTSNKGQGTSFKVRLPYGLKNLPQSILLDAKNEKPEHIQTRSKEENIISNRTVNKVSPIAELPIALVVEDNEDLRVFVSDILNNHYKILLAKDGLQGERMAFEHIPDIIISDVMMPKKDGYQLCHSLKTNSKTSHIPLIMLTAKAGHSNKMEGLTQGADGYLTKPFKEDELLVRMKNFIDGRKKMWEHFKSSDLLIIDDLKLSSIDDLFLQKVVQTIKSNLDNELLSIEDIAKAVGFSRSQLHRKLKALINKSANQLVVEMRLNEAKKMLKNKVGSVSEIAYSVGYSNMSYFTKSFKEKFGILPSKIQD